MPKPNAAKPELWVCETCKYSKDSDECNGKRGGQILFETINKLAGKMPGRESYDIKTTRCLMGCEHHCNVHMRAPGKICYVAGSFAPNLESADAVLDYFHKYMASATGQVPYKTWPQGIKGHFVARIPPFAIVNEENLCAIVNEENNI